MSLGLRAQRREGVLNPGTNLGLVGRDHGTGADDSGRGLKEARLSAGADERMVHGARLDRDALSKTGLIGPALAAYGPPPLATPATIAGACSRRLASNGPRLAKAAADGVGTLVTEDGRAFKDSPSTIRSARALVRSRTPSARLACDGWSTT